MGKLKVGVREFAVPLKREGSLSPGSGVGFLPLDLGQEAHDRIQLRLRETDALYQAEYALQHTFQAGPCEIKVRGLCDGFFDRPVPLLEEIKSSHRWDALQRDLEKQPEHPYRLQIKMYGYLYWLKTARLPELQLRVVDLQSLQEIVLPIAFDPEMFQVWVKARCEQIEAGLKHMRALMKTRQRLARKLFFPFAQPRPSQDQLIESVQAALTNQRHLLLQAPTGLGKTAGVLFPALKHALGRGAPLVYIAPKNSQFQAAEDLARLYHKEKIGLKVLVLTSKAKACRQTEVSCQDTVCAYARDYYDKVEDAALVPRDGKKNLWDRRYFHSLSERFTVCPYEISMERLREADLIICDYNYVFSPHANFLSRYQDPILPLPAPVLVIDEAHNLHDRVRDAWTAEIRLSTLQNCLDAAAPRPLRSVLQKAMNLLESLRPAAPEACIEVDAQIVRELLQEAWRFLLAQWSESGLPDPTDPLFLFINAWSSFEAMLEFSREAVPLVYKREAGDTILKALCLDPAGFIEPVLGQFAGVIAFSATLKPFAFYRDMNGFDPDRTECLELTSPFPRAHKKILIIPQVQTSLRERELHYARIAQIIQRVSGLQHNPSLCFFSSYSFLREVRRELLRLQPDRSIYTQDAALGQDQLKQLLARLREKPQDLLIFAVQGGSLAEGIDFRGFGIGTVFIVGPALPTADFERRLLQDYLEKKYQRGRAYTYTYPAMTKSIQAAGRIVRDESERGVIVLMDPRFLEPDYQETMPADWFEQSARELVSQQIMRDVKNFIQPDQPLV